MTSDRKQLAREALGAALGIALAAAVSSVGIPMPPPPNSNLPYTAHILVLPSIVANAFFIGLGATVFASVIPAVRVSRIPIATALRVVSRDALRQPLF